MGKVAVISYRRTVVEIAFVDWKNIVDQFPPITKEGNDERKDLGLVGSVMRYRDIIDRNLVKRKCIEEPAPTDINLDEDTGEDLIRTALDYILEDDEVYRICITGYGPFLNFKISHPNANPDKIELSKNADPPFSAIPIGQLVSEYIENHPRENKPKFDIITDVQACAVAGYWLSASDATINGSFDAPHVVAAYIMSRGVGGSIVMGQGFTFLSNHHSEAGHMPINRHVSDFLDEQMCRHHPFCLTGHVGSPSIERRAAFMGLDMDELFEKEGHGIWTIVTDYLAQMCITSISMYAPTQIFIGGGTIEKAKKFLIPRINALCKEKMQDFSHYNDLKRLEDPENYFVQAYSRSEWMMFGGLLYAIDRGSVREA